MSTKERPTPESERQIEFAMAMFSKDNPARFEHVCTFARSLEKQRDELREAVQDAQQVIESVNCSLEVVSLASPELVNAMIRDLQKVDDALSALLTRNNDKKEDK